ncbi:MAG: ATPase, T2SS/T4P/T4SS family [Candidatus Gastranaerophilales bacterium]|nr:ATPase, T2SS/T4P/T4SS family [Candidatus Gastranaerophilales bacterium]
MSLKSRLLNKKNNQPKEEDSFIIQKPIESVEPAKIDLLNYFEMHNDIDSITIYGVDKIYCEKNNLPVETDLFFPTDESILKEINAIANKFDKIINAQNPTFSLILSNGVKVDAIIPPLIENGAFLSIKKNNSINKKKTDFIKEKAISNEMILFLKECLKNKLNIFITGDANVDKTSVLNFILNLSNKENSLITLEAIPELKPKTEKIVNLIKHHGNIQKTIKKALKLNFDRFAISNCEINELITVFEYINQGYNGFVTSFSTKSCNSFLSSVQSLILLNHPNMSKENTDTLISSSIDIVVQVAKTADEQERIIAISEIDETKSTIKSEDIFIWKESSGKTTRTKAHHISTGAKSKFFSSDICSSLSFSDNYFEKTYKHNYIDTYDSFSTDITEKRSKTLNKLKKLKQIKE